MSMLLACGSGAAFGAWYSPRKHVTAADQGGLFSSSEFRNFRLVTSQYETHDSRRFFFAIPDPAASANIPVASCILAKFVETDGKEVVRPYTPISTNNVKGRFELLIKRYPRSKMGTHIFSMKPGEELAIKGPFEKFKYVANQWSHIGMIAGGTGITPMYQVIRAIIDNPKDKTRISLVYANNSRRDILLNNELSEICRTFPNFHAYFTLLEVPKRWLGGVGFINPDMLKTFMPAPQEKNTKVLVCGPPPMMKAVSGDKDYSKGAPQQGDLSGILKDLGYTSDQVFKF